MSTLSTVSKIPYTVDKTCHKHRLLKSRQVPRTDKIEINPRQLFAIGSLILQDPKVGRRTFDQTQRLWKSLHEQYNVYLRFAFKDIIGRAEGETLTKLSEIVGIACGLAVLHKETSINYNRVRRVPPQGKGRRVDFEFIKSRVRYYHETKGTTYPDRVEVLTREIHAQKFSTLRRAKTTPSSREYGGATGTITEYQHKKRKGHQSHIYLIDPPVTRKNATIENPNEEIATILRYYFNFYSITHLNPQNPGILGLKQWLGKVINDIEAGIPPPLLSPVNLVAKGRVSEPGHPESTYKGTLFDARLMNAAVRQYDSFAMATAEISNPVTFVGVSQEVTDLVLKCDWNGLLHFRDNRVTQEEGEIEGATILDSGIMVKSVTNDQTTEEYARHEFATMKRLSRLSIA